MTTSGYFKKPPKSYKERGLDEPDLEHYLYEIYDLGLEKEASGTFFGGSGKQEMDFARKAWDLVREKYEK